MSYTRLFCCIISLFVCCTHVQGQTVGKDEGYENEPMKEDKPAGSPFPFVINTMEAHYNLYLDLTDSAIVHLYRPVFLRHRFAFTGDTWDEVIKQILEQHNAQLARVLNTIPEDEGLQISTGTGKNSQESFLKILQPILNDERKLDDFLSHHIDRNRIPE